MIHFNKSVVEHIPAGHSLYRIFYFKKNEHRAPSRELYNWLQETPVDAYMTNEAPKNGHPPVGWNLFRRREVFYMIRSVDVIACKLAFHHVLGASIMVADDLSAGSISRLEWKMFGN